MKGTTKEEVNKRLRKALSASTTPAAEIAALTGEDGSDEEIWVDTQQELADALKVDRRSVLRYVKEPGSPRKVKGRYSVLLWKEWMDTTGKSSSHSVEPASPMKYELEVRKLTAVCERLELDQKIRLNQYHLDTDCKLWVGKAMTSVRTILLAIPSKMAPVLEMRPKEECEALLREAIDEALIAIHEKEWPTSRSAKLLVTPEKV